MLPSRNAFKPISACPHVRLARLALTCADVFLRSTSTTTARSGALGLVRGAGKILCPTLPGLAPNLSFSFVHQCFLRLDADSTTYTVSYRTREIYLSPEVVSCKHPTTFSPSQGPYISG